MSTNTTPKQFDTLMKEMTHHVTVALIFFSVAWFCLTVGVFTANPTGPIGIFFLCIGLVCVAISIYYFVRYAMNSNRAKKMM